MSAGSYYAQASVEIHDSEMWLTRMAEALGTRVLAKPMLSKKPMTGILIDGQHRVEAVRRALVKIRMPKKHERPKLIFAHDSPRGVWTLFEGHPDEILNLIAQIPVELEPQSIEATSHYARFSVLGLKGDTELFSSRIADLFGDRVTVLLRPLALPPVDGILELGGSLAAELDAKDVEIVASAILRGYFETPRKTSQAEIAKRLGISKAELSRRMKKLQEIGFRTALASSPVSQSVAETMAKTYQESPQLFFETKEPSPGLQSRSEAAQKSS